MYRTNLLSKAIDRQKKMEDHLKYLQTDDWNQIRLHILKRDNYTCVMCGRNGGRLYVHHKTYQRWSKEHLNDLITLCYNCHEEIHGRN